MENNSVSNSLSRRMHHVDGPAGNLRFHQASCQPSRPDMSEHINNDVCQSQLPVHSPATSSVGSIAQVPTRRNIQTVGSETMYLPDHTVRVTCPVILMCILRIALDTQMVVTIFHTMVGLETPILHHLQWCVRIKISLV